MIYPIEPKRVDTYPCHKPPWGFVDIIVIFILIMLFGVFFGLFGARLVNRVLVLFPQMGSFKAAALYTAGFLQGILLVALVLISAWLRKGSLASLGLQNFSWRSLFVYGVNGGFGVFLLVTILMSLITSFVDQPLEPQPVAELILNARSWSQIILPLVLVGIFAPVSEELFFRGFIFPVLRSRLGAVWGIIATACFFGIMHFDLVRFIPLAIGGACLAFFCEKSKSLYPAIAAHSMWNTVMTLFVFFYNMNL